VKKQKIALILIKEKFRQDFDLLSFSQKKPSFGQYSLPKIVLFKSCEASNMHRICFNLLPQCKYTFTNNGLLKMRKIPAKKVQLFLSAARKFCGKTAPFITSLSSCVFALGFDVFRCVVVHNSLVVFRQRLKLLPPTVPSLQCAKCTFFISYSAQLYRLVFCEQVRATHRVLMHPPAFSPPLFPPH